MSSLIILILSLLCFSSLLTTTLSIPTPIAAGNVTGDAPTAYDLLQSYGFPVGLLPIGIKGYDLNKNTGKFSLYLDDLCTFSLVGGYKLKYKTTIKGHISQNKLKNLSGISVQLLFIWFNIVEVDRNDDEMTFSVGLASANFPIDSFYECPQCGCGFDCSSDTEIGQDSKLKETR